MRYTVISNNNFNIVILGRNYYKIYKIYKMHTSLISLLVICMFVVVTNADYIDLNGTTYQVNSQSCPLGQLYDFVTFGAGNVTNMVAKFNQSNSYSVLVAMNNTINSMTNLYVTSTSSANVNALPYVIGMFGSLVSVLAYMW
ncbi:MAG: hypothetical protein Terrestrivirus5_95 [Terrestrivirus sp.]|uniref:Uncharacterized protein n=1 Tax=Terrestrivirus sp. TaxID=2487775 RepID=A0A3G4ZRP9_9VIRU|nr:MAG: hypothetical protein Terrestrivirus5_95 [Terrestrivirus sp.]